MAKRRKKRTSPNIPEKAIERARQQLGDVDDTDQPANARTVEDAPQGPESRQKRRRKERSSSGPADVVQYSQLSKKNREDLDNATIEQMLAHPTKFVTEEELREDYQHVIRDLRNMAMLSAGLLVALIVLGQLI